MYTVSNRVIQTFLGIFLVFSLAFSSYIQVIAESRISQYIVSTGLSIQDAQRSLDESKEHISGNGLLVKGKNLKPETLSGVAVQAVADTDVAPGLLPTTLKDYYLVSYESFDELKKGYTSLLLTPAVEHVQPLYSYKPLYVPADPQYGPSQWYLKNQVSGINAEGAWDSLGDSLGITCGTDATQLRCGGQTSVKIAVIDTGVNQNLTEAGNGLPVFNTSRFDTVNSARYYSKSGSSSVTCDNPTDFNWGYGLFGFAGVYCTTSGSQFDESGHGSIVTQVIAAGNNTQGGVGVAYNTTVLPIALHGGAMNTYFLTDALYRAVTAGAKVINLSLGSVYYDPFLETAINSLKNLGIIIVAASGNCGAVTAQGCGFVGADNTVVNPPVYPGAFSSVITVGASTYGASTGAITRATYSSFGSQVDVVAPVGNSTDSSSKGVIGYCATSVSTCSGITVGNIGTFYGTSFASPQVAGIIGLMLSINPSLNFDQIKRYLQHGSTDVGVSGFDTQFGEGVVNANRAMTAVSYSDLQHDLLVSNTGSGQVEVWLSRTDGVNYKSVTLGTRLESEGWQVAATGDFNRDGAKDILWRNLTTGATQIWLLNSAAVVSFTINLDTVLPASGWQVSGVGDFNGDGITDILWRNLMSGETHVWRLNSFGGKGGTSILDTVLPASGWQVSGVGDFNGDGITDILWRNLTTGETHAWRMNGSGGKGGTSVLDVVSNSSGWSVTKIDDFNGDGITDILWRNLTTGETHAWRMNGSGGKGGTSVLDVVSNSSGWSVKLTGDVNGDGRSDILWRNATTSENHVWLLSSSATKSGTAVLTPFTEASGYFFADVL